MANSSSLLLDCYIISLSLERDYAAFKQLLKSMAFQGNPQSYQTSPGKNCCQSSTMLKKRWQPLSSISLVETQPTLLGNYERAFRKHITLQLASFTGPSHPDCRSKLIQSLIAEDFSPECCEGASLMMHQGSHQAMPGPILVTAHLQNLD